MLLRVLVVLLLAVGPLRSQGEGTFPVRAFGLEQGLAITAVTALAEDQLGLLWAGTEGGLFRFDGRSWHAVEVALPSRFVTGLRVDRTGSLWVATRSGLASFPPLRPDLAKPAAGVPATIASQLGEDAEGRCWVLASGMPMVQGPGGVFAPDPRWPPARPAVALFAHPECAEVLCTDGRTLYSRTRTDGSWVADLPPQGQAPDLLIAVAEDGTGARWARSDRAAYRKRAGGTGWERVSASLFGPSPDTANLTRDREGWIWINTGRRMVRVRGEAQLTLPAGDGIGESITALVDRSGSWWFGWSGVRQVPGGGAWRHFRSAEGLPSSTVWHLLRDPERRLWAATDLGVAVATDRGWRTVHTGQASRIRRLPDGALLVAGSPGGTVHRVDPRTLQVRSQRVDVLAPTAVMRGLAVLPDGGLLVSDFADGVAHGRPAGDHWTWSLTPVEGKPAQGVWVLQQDVAGNVFLAMGNALFQWTDGAWRRIPDTLGCTPFLGVVRGDGTLVVSYFDRPVFTLHQWKGSGWVRTAVQEPFGRDLKLTVYSALEGRGGAFWIGTSQGLVRLAPGLDRVAEWQGPGEGAPGADSNAGALLLEENGDLWLGTTEGLGRLRPRPDLEEQLPPAPVCIEPMRPAGTPDPVRLPARGSLAVTFAAPACRSGGRIQLQTRMVGLDRNWVDQELFSVRAGRLPPGRFVLEARFVLPGGGHGPTVRLPFQVDPLWWETWWARTGGLLGLGGMAAGLHALRARQLRRRNVQLEAQVADRVSELRALMRTLEVEKARADEASNAKSAFLAAMSHELRTPLNAILLYADLAQDQAESRGEAEISRDVGKILGAGKHLLAMINDVLDLSKIEEGRMALHPEPVALPELLAELESTLRPLASHRRNQLLVEAPAGLPLLWVDRVRLTQVLLNLGANACKFTEAGLVRIEIEVRAARMAFRVRDTGIGMSAEEAAAVFAPYTQATPGIHRRFGGTGLGLSISHKFVELMGGRLVVESEPGNGSCFSFDLPIGPAPTAPA